jgi:hypothetical protein
MWLTLLAEPLDFLVSHLFESNVASVRIFHRFRELIKLGLTGRGVACLRVLNEKNHQKRDNTHRVRDQRSGVGKAKELTDSPS